MIDLGENEPGGDYTEFLDGRLSMAEFMEKHQQRYAALQCDLEFVTVGLGGGGGRQGGGRCWVLLGAPGTVTDSAAPINSEMEGCTAAAVHEYSVPCLLPQASRRIPAGCAGTADEPSIAGKARRTAARYWSRAPRISSFMALRAAKSDIAGGLAKVRENIRQATALQNLAQDLVVQLRAARARQPEPSADASSAASEGLPEQGLGRPEPGQGPGTAAAALGGSGGGAGTPPTQPEPQQSQAAQRKQRRAHRRRAL